MNQSTITVLQEYANKYRFISQIEKEIVNVFSILNDCFENGGKLLICGNGGSAADADHIVGELLKGFTKSRPLSKKQKNKYKLFGSDGEDLAVTLQGSLPAINLCAHTSLITAVINDIGGEKIFAQQVVGYGNKDDVLLGISTSGNSKNIINAGIVAKVQNMKTVALTGEKGGKMSGMFDVTIKVPSLITCDIQDMHSIVYHLLCAMLEVERWEE